MNDLSILQTFGQQLLAERERLGLSIDDVAARTKLHRKYIEAIDAGAPEKLPSGPYRKAFYRDYARAVGIKLSESDAAALDAAATASSSVTEQSVPRTTPAGKAPRMNPITDSLAGKAIGAMPKFASRMTGQTAHLASNAAKSAAKTTGTVIRTIEEGTKGTVGALTSRDLWDEAEEVRRERLGIKRPEPHEAEVRQETPEPVAKAPIPTASVSTRADSVRSIAAAIPSSARAQENEPDTGHLSTDAEREVRMDVALPTMADISVVHEGENAHLTRGSAVETEVAPAPAASNTSITKYVIFAVLLIFAAVVFYAMRQTKHERTPDHALNNELATEEVLPPPAPVTEDSVMATPANTDTAAASLTTGPLKLTLRAKDAVWVSVTPDNGAGFRGEMKPGDVQEITADRRMVLNIGNTKALDITFNGEPLSALPTISNSAIVVRNLVLTRDRAYIQAPDTTAKRSTTPQAKPAATPSKPTPVKPKIQIPYAPGKQPAAAVKTNQSKPASTVKSVPIKPAVRTKPRSPNEPRLNRNTTIPTVEPAAPKAD